MKRFLLATLIMVARALPQGLDPGVVVTNPSDNDGLRVNHALNLTASVQYPPAEPYSVHYFAIKPGALIESEIGSSKEAPDYACPWTPKDTGYTQLRAEVQPDIGLPLGSSPQIAVHVWPQNVLPTVTLDAPKDGAKFFAPAGISMTATAVDHDAPGQGGGISVVRFYNDTALLATRTPAQGFAFTWGGVAPGQYNLLARATDLDGAVVSSAVSRVTVRPPNAAPVVSLGVTPASPPYVAPQDFVLTANASDSDDSIAKVEFYRGSTLLGTDSVGPAFTYSGTVSQPGTYSLTAKAFDNYGLATVSSPVSVTVAGNQKPVANAGKDLVLVYPADTLAALDGSASSDLEGPIASYLWSGPAAFADPTASKTTANFHGAAPSNYTLTLTVTDGGKPPLQGIDTVIVTVAKSPKIYSSLTATALVDSEFTYFPLDSAFPKSNYTFTNKQWLVWDTVSRSLHGKAAAPGNLQVSMTARNVTNVPDTKILNITINQAPKIVTDIQNDSATISEKGKISLSVTAIGTPAPTYQWQFQAGTGTFVNVGTNSPAYAIDTASLSQAGHYQVLVRNGIGAGAKSKSFKLIVKPLPKPITVADNLQGQTAIKDSKVVLHVKFSGEPPLSYQWFQDGKSLGGPVVDDTNHVIKTVQLADAGLYRVRVTNNVPDSAWSDTASLIVHLRRLPKPLVNPATPSFKARFSATLTCDTPQVQIFYTLNGKTPNRASQLYTAPIPIDTFTQTLKAIAYKDGFDSSTILTQTYAYTPPDQLPAPIISPQTTTFKVLQKFTLKDDTAAAAIYYTLNGSDPATSSGIKYDTALTVNSTTTVKAFARKSGLRDSPLMSWTYTKEPTQIGADRPIAEPPGKPFTGQIDIALKSNSDAYIKYTLDGSDPLKSPTADSVRSGGLVTLTRSAVLKAFAYGSNYSPSDTIIQSYQLVPGPIAASPDPNNFFFEKTVKVTLSVSPPQATLYYSTDNTPPLDKTGNLLPGGRLYPDSGIVLDSTQTVTAMAVYNKVVSPPYPFGYTQRGGRVAIPNAVTAGNATTFYDSITVALTAAQGAVIRYTLNGDRPDVSGKVYDKPFVIDSTTTLQAQAFKDKFLDSKNLVANFTLLPDTPSISIKGGSYSTLKPIVITARSRHTPIRYTLDGSDPRADSGFVYSSPITLTAGATLKAVTVSGNLVSPVHREAYIIFGSRDTVLAPGQSYYMQGGYVLVNPEDQGSSVKVGLGPADSLNLKGFENVQYRISLSAAKPGQDFPRMKFTSPRAETRSLYQVEPNGLIYFISSADTVTLSDPGIYFMGEDVSPPSVSYLPEKFDGSDSTVVQFHIEDNVANLSYDVKRSDDTGLDAAQQPFFAPGNLEIKLKNGAGSFQPLYLQLAVHDYQLSAYVPDDPSSMMALSQKVAMEIKGPPLWTVGASEADPWDLISVPFDLSPALRLGDFSPGHPVQGGVWNEQKSNYDRMGSGDTLAAGKAYWIGSHSPLHAFAHPAAKIAAHGPGRYKVRLRQGWNQVGNPSMVKMYWPFPRYEDAASGNLRGAYAGSLIKGLWAYIGGGLFEESDTLAPWRGYLVYDYGGDTTVELSSTPIPRTGLKKEGAARPPRISLAWARAQGVTLGADPSAADGAGREDEMELPARGPFRLRALREGRRLASDWIHFNRGGVLEWKIAMAGGNLRDTLAPLRISALGLPEGYEAWIVSEARGMKFKLSPGAEIRPSGLPEDTLSVVAGPAAKLAELGYLKDKRAFAPSAVDAAVVPQAGGFVLRLALPERAQVRAVLWEMRGRRLADFLPGFLAEGAYRFSYEDFRKLGARPAEGIYFLTLDIRGASSSSRMTKKVLLRY